MNTIMRNLHIETEKPINYMLDEELFQGKSPLNVAVGPRLKVVRSLAT